MPNHKFDENFDYNNICLTICKNICDSYELIAQILILLKNFLSSSQNIDQIRIIEAKLSIFSNIIEQKPLNFEEIRAFSSPFCQICQKMHAIVIKANEIKEEVNAKIKLRDQEVYSPPAERVYEVAEYIIQNLKDLFANSRPFPMKFDNDLTIPNLFGKNGKSSDQFIETSQRMVLEFEIEVKERDLSIERTLNSNLQIDPSEVTLNSQKIQFHEEFFLKSQPFLVEKLKTFALRHEMAKLFKYFHHFDFEKLNFSSKHQFITHLTERLQEHAKNRLKDRELFIRLMELLNWFTSHDTFGKTGRCFSHVYKGTILVINKCFSLAGDLYGLRFKEKELSDFEIFLTRLQILQNVVENYLRIMGAKSLAKLKEIISHPSQQQQSSSKERKKVQKFEDIAHWKGLVCVDDVIIEESQNKDWRKMSNFQNISIDPE